MLPKSVGHMVIDRLLEIRSTRASTVERESKRWPVSIQLDRSLVQNRLWIFSDGGALGWHAVVLIESGLAHRVAMCRPNSARNVGSELDGVILGLQLAITGSSIVIVSDFLWTGYYINGWRAVSHPYLRERVPVARDLLVSKQFADPVFIHHGGHDGEATDYSRWNEMADTLCKQRMAVDDRIEVVPP